MNRIFATIMLTVHLFNMGGYLLLNQYLVYQSDKVATEQISHGRYDVNNLIEIKIKQNLPQIHDWQSYVRISGQIQFNGTSYNYVKLKMTRDTMYVQCIPNYQTTKLLNENVICAKQGNDIPVSKKEHEASGKKTGADNKYNFPVVEYAFFTPPPPAPKFNTFVYISIKNPVVTTAGRPPEILA